MSSHPMPMELPPFEPEMATRLRFEAEQMAAAYFETLLSRVGSELLDGVYVKGSAYKPWESLVDYVPDLSDVDIHVRFATAADAEHHFESLPRALELAAAAMTAFHARVPSPSHVPRPQLLSLNDLESEAGYLPSPQGTVHTLHGVPYAGSSRSDYDELQAADARSFLVDHRFVTEELPGKVIDRPGAHAWRAVGTLVWRVSPTGPRLLTQLGMHPHDAWCLNRTGIVRALEEHGAHEVAAAYAGFYLAGWDGYRSGFRDGGAARRALDAVERLFSLGAGIVEAASQR